jgi:two-component system nitrogen regulation response regulator GlnG
MDYLCKLNWNGNIRQLENTCRWFNVMATGAEIQMSDLPDELLAKDRGQDKPIDSESTGHWEDVLRVWAQQELAAGQQNILSEASTKLEKTLLECALESSGGRKQEAARLLGWGRNTLTRKLKKLEKLGSDHD